MTRKELLRLLERVDETQIEDEIYNRNGIDNVSRVFLYSLKLNEHHQNRKKIFRNYTGYEQRY